MNVEQIIVKFLEEKEVDSLYNDGYECGCHKLDLAPCGGFHSRCEPALKTKTGFILIDKEVNHD